MSNKLKSVESLENKCATCAYWAGDKIKAKTMFAENPKSMHLAEGWPHDGECRIDHKFMATEVRGNAFVEVVFDANFGCVYWDGVSND